MSRIRHSILRDPPLSRLGVDAEVLRHGHGCQPVAQQRIPKSVVRHWDLRTSRDMLTVIETSLVVQPGGEVVTCELVKVIFTSPRAKVHKGSALTEGSSFMKLYIDMAGKQVQVTRDPEPKKDQNGNQKSERDSGRPMWSTQVCV